MKVRGIKSPGETTRPCKAPDHQSIEPRLCHLQSCRGCFWVWQELSEELVIGTRLDNFFPKSGGARECFPEKIAKCSKSSSKSWCSLSLLIWPARMRSGFLKVSMRIQLVAWTWKSWDHWQFSVHWNIYTIKVNLHFLVSWKFLVGQYKYCNILSISIGKIPQRSHKTKFIW